MSRLFHEGLRAPLLLLLALGACGGEPRDEGAGSTAESAAPPAVEGARAEEPSGAPKIFLPIVGR